MLLPSIIQENFLSSDECEFISDTVCNSKYIYNDIIHGLQYSVYYTWGYYKPEFKEIRKILDTKLQNLIKLELVVDHSHILDSTTPYNIHTDYYQEKNIPGLEPAYTYIIPLADYNSHTVAFNQSSTIKSFSEYLREKNPPTIDAADRISQENIDKYFSHLNPKFFDYLSIKEIFSWKKGCMYACDRKYFHTSDNYHKKGVQNKRAIIMWTSFKK